MPEHRLNDLVTATEAAELVPFSSRTLRRYAQRGQVAAVVSPGGHHRFRVRDVLALATPARLAEHGTTST